MGKIYLFNSGSELIKSAIEFSLYKKSIINIDGSYNNKFLRIIRFLHLKSNLNSTKWWVKFKVKSLNIENSNNNTIILFDSPVWINNVKYIRRKYDKLNLVFWYWNIVNDPKKIKHIKKYCDSVYTFDEKDSIKYKIGYHPQFYWLNKPIETEKKYDVLFVGRNKGRLKVLEDIFLKFKKEGLKPFFYVVRDNRNEFSNILDLKKENLKYDQVLELIYASKIILEINQQDQEGLTLRALESLFFNKKLITNNQSLKKYNFYSANNIMIINESFNLKKKFINKRNINVEYKIKETYTFDHWLEILSKIK
jgi:hypothetical protein